MITHPDAIARMNMLIDSDPEDREPNDRSENESSG